LPWVVQVVAARRANHSQFVHAAARHLHALNNFSMAAVMWSTHPCLIC
jgi:hypothetical protein